MGSNHGGEGVGAGVCPPNLVHTGKNVQNHTSRPTTTQPARQKWGYIESPYFDLMAQRLERRDWRSGGPRFKSHPRRTFQSWSRYQLNQLGSKAASDSTLKQLTTCGVSNNCTLLENQAIIVYKNFLWLVAWRSRRRIDSWIVGDCRMVGLFVCRSVDWKYGWSVSIDLFVIWSIDRSIEPYGACALGLYLEGTWIFVIIIRLAS